MMRHQYRNARWAVIAGLSVLMLPALIQLATAQSGLPQETPAASIAGPPIQPPTDYFLRYLSPNMTLASYLDRLRREFRAADADADGEITEADGVLHGQMVAATFRAMFIATLMPADLNGDGVVTEDELRIRLRYDRYTLRPMVLPGTTDQEQLEKQIKEIMAADADHDGSVSFDEARNYAASRANPMAQFASHGVRQFLALAPEGKRTLTLADFEAAAEKLFRAVDADGDGTVSADELKNFRPGLGASSRSTPPIAPSQQRPAQTSAPPPPPALQRPADATRTAFRENAEASKQAGCGMPKASEAAKVVVISSRETEAFSSVAIGSQDVPVRTGVIEVEPGNEPIYLVAIPFESIIWRLKGAVDRVERLVLTTSRAAMVGGRLQDKPLVGATGIAADRITFLPAGQCLNNFLEVPSSGSAAALAAINRETGKEAATVVAQYSISDVSVPSGNVHSLRGADAKKVVVIQQSAGELKVVGSSDNVVIYAAAVDPETNLKRYSPGGVETIDPGAVVAPFPVEKYEVLPEEAGLIQLLREGKIAQNHSGEYLIKQKIRFPSGLYGGHGVKFLLLKGVPEPDGDPGHSDVISEETGNKLSFGKKP
jgi:Ca2+-binding EF-hand superfamily protein